MSRLKSKEKSEQQALKEWLVNNYINIACNLFRYKGLEAFGENLTSQIFEKMLIFDGKACGFKDDKLGLLILPCGGLSRLNVYGIPQDYICVGYNGQTFKRNVNNSVLIKNNGTYSPDYPMIDYYCGRIADCEMAKKININANKMPFALSGDPDQLLTMKNIVEQVTTNKVALYMPKKVRSASADPVEVKVINTGAEFIADKINDSQQDYISSLLTFLGLDNVSVEKRERLNTIEAGANNEHIKSNLYLKLQCREEACKQLNEMFRTNLSVSINYDYIEDFIGAQEEQDNAIKEEDTNNE